MEGRTNPEDVMRVMVFFLACGVLITCFTELMLDRIEDFKTQMGDRYETWADWWRHNGV